MTARDIRYGRRAGKWAGPGADALLVEIRSARLEALRADRYLTAEAYADPRNRSWPIESLPHWIELADTIQSFPSGYPWQGSRLSIGRQIGNAVPPPLAGAVLRAVLR